MAQNTEIVKILKRWETLSENEEILLTKGFSAMSPSVDGNSVTARPWTSEDTKATTKTTKAMVFICRQKNDSKMSFPQSFNSLPEDNLLD